MNYTTVFIAILGFVTLFELCNSSSVTKNKPRKVILKRKRILATTPIPTTSSTSEPEYLETISQGPHSSETDPNVSQESSHYENTRKEEHISQSSTSLTASNAETRTSQHRTRAFGNTRTTARVQGNHCDECIPEDCETPPATSCPIGLTMDICSCCQICASAEGNRCYNASLGIPYNPIWGVCGAGLTCQLRNDLESYEQKEALCECGSKKTVCGSDNRTYQSECKLHEAAHLYSNLTLKNWHPCYSAPSIPVQVENITVGTGEDISLSCEVRAFPPPVIHWQFLPEDSSSPIILPGDDSSVVVTIRGGPEQIMTTSWIQIVSVSPNRQGIYYCFAKNDEGMTQSSGTVSVYNNY